MVIQVFVHDKTNPHSKLSLIVLLQLIFSTFLFQQLNTSAFPNANEGAWKKQNLMPGFVSNMGQMDPDIAYFSHLSSGLTLFLQNAQVVWQWQEMPNGSDQFATMKWLYGNRTTSVSGEKELAMTSSYFIGDNPNDWRSDVRHYASVRYRNIYSRIDLVFYHTNGDLEFDFEIQPGANPNDIVLNFGSEKFLDSSGDLVLSPAKNELRIKKPVAYQLYGGIKKLIASNFILKKTGEIGFKTGKYDRSRSLIIDPVVVFASYDGGNSDDRANAIAVDQKGNSYITGFARSLRIPLKRPLQSKRKGARDIFISKISPSGNLIYSTFLGGKGELEEGRAITVDNTGQAIVTGITSSPNFPVRSALQPRLHGSLNAFVTKLSSNGSRLVFSTYFGGSSFDFGNAITLDNSGAIYIAGTTDSPDFPTASGLQSSIQGLADAFVSKVSADGSTILYSTYLGGGADDFANGLFVDDRQYVYVTGSTDSRDFPVRQPLQSKLKGFSDAFVTKIHPSGSRLVFSTYVGGARADVVGGQDIARGIAVDSSRNIWITGLTTSRDFPLVKPFQSAIKGTTDVFVLKLNRRGSEILFSTYLGGESSEDGFGVTLDQFGNAYVVGRTHSRDFPVLNTLQEFNAGKSFGDDVFVTVFDRSAQNILFSTYLGGRAGEVATGIAVLENFIYICGFTSSDDFPIVNPFQSYKKGNLFSHDAFVVKIGLVP